jgi:peptide/nickel transport system permease protein
MKPVILWSDLLIYLLIFSITIFLRGMLKNPQIRDKWKQVFSQKLGVTTFIIVCGYCMIAFLDSLHFQKSLPESNNTLAINETHYETKVTSVLDLILGEMPTNVERTYSAPFSLKSYSKTMMKDENNNLYRDFERLEFAGVHLETDDQYLSDIIWQSALSILAGACISIFFIALHRQFFKSKPGSTKLSFIPWKYAYITFAIIVTVITWLLHLGNLYHILGTDMSGNDVLYKSLKGIRTGVLIGTLATLIMLPIAIILGIAAGYFKGWVDDAVQYSYTTLSSIPSILLIASSVLLFNVFIENNQELFELGLQKADARFLGLCFILGVTSWATLCRLLRAETLKISQLDYVQAAHAFGVSHARIILRHILPNVSHIILITFILDFSMLILAEAVLSYIGIGVDPSMASWGNMINLARSELSREPTVWWTLAGAFTFMFALVLSANLFSDLVQDAFDPRTVNGASNGL